MLSAVTWTLAISMGLVPRSAPLTADAALDSPIRHVRTTDLPMKRLLRTGFERSPTFAALFARLERSDVIVYLEEVARLPGALDGRLLFLPPSRGARYVRIQVAQRGTPCDQIAVIGHELRHAVEIAEASSVVDPEGVAALYRRIGVDHGNNEFDTLEAQEVGRQVRRELTA